MANMTVPQQYGNAADRKMYRRDAQEECKQRKIERETEYFWGMVERNRRQNNRPPSLAKEREERMLFGGQGNVGIKFDTYDSIPVEVSGPGAEGIPPITAFSDLTETIPEFLAQNISRMKYDIPTPIQKNAVPLALNGRDLMCSAQTGSGKTCAFLLPMISAITAMQVAQPRHPMCIDDRGVHPLAVVLAPTRELAAQIHLESKKLCFDSQLRSLVLYGGSEIRNQLSDLSFGCDIIVATPGRLIDIIDRGIISLSDVAVLILDEADRMLDMGFEPQIREIVQMRDMPPKERRQTLMFSATFKPEIQTLASEFLMDYVWIGVGRVGSTVENIKQNIVLATSDPMVKLGLVLEAINATQGRTLIFVQKKKTAAWLSEALRYECNVRVDDIHSDKSQMQREASLKRFRDGHVRVLVGTDVAARGLDIADVSHVIQFDLPLTPDEFDTFVHRMGRTGRAGHDGIATSLFVPGNEVGEGNGRIAPLMLKLLEETGQDVPDWFRDLAKEAGRGRGKASKFTSRDVRTPMPNHTQQTYNAAAPAYYPTGRGGGGYVASTGGGGYGGQQQYGHGVSGGFGGGGRGRGGGRGGGRFSGGRNPFPGYGQQHQHYPGYNQQQYQGYSQQPYQQHVEYQQQQGYDYSDYNYAAHAAGGVSGYGDPNALAQGMQHLNIQQQPRPSPPHMANGRSPRAMQIPRPPPIATTAARMYHAQSYGQPSPQMGIHAYGHDVHGMAHVDYSMMGHAQASSMYQHDGSMEMHSPFFVPPSPNDVSPRYAMSPYHSQDAVQKYGGFTYQGSQPQVALTSATNQAKDSRVATPSSTAENVSTTTEGTA